LADATSVVQKTLELEIGELRGDPQLLDLMHASVEGNIATVLHAIHHNIPIERVESPTAALEYARRLAQRGVPANALVRAYRIAHKVVLGMMVEGIQEVDADPTLGLDVFGRIAAVSFRYIDWISQQVVEVYEADRGLWLENRSHPPDVDLLPVSRTVGESCLVDEFIVRFTHTTRMDWMLPGIEPTGRAVEIPTVAIVQFQEDKLVHEHIYWDQASVLVQLGLLDPDGLPIAGAETARKVLDVSLPSNTLMTPSQ
jgi:hypothetical protein